jgi:hypothetical protein
MTPFASLKAHAAATAGMLPEDEDTEEEEDQYANRTEWEIPYEDIVLGARVGEGYGARVFYRNMHSMGGAIEPHAFASLEASRRVTFPSGVHQ